MMNKTLCLLLVLLSFFVFLSGCDEEVAEVIEPEITSLAFGQWISEGVNLASLFTDSLTYNTLVLNEDSTYLMTQEDTLNVTFSYSGTYIIDESDTTTKIYSITFLQFSPDTVTYEGIYEVNSRIEPDELTIEWVETYPKVSNNPPNVVDGFGSTSDGELGVTNVQKYIRVVE